MVMKLKGICSSPDDLFVFNRFSSDATSSGLEENKTMEEETLFLKKCV